MIGMPKPFIADERQEILKAPMREFVVNPENTRRHYDPGELSTLAVSIGNLGVQVPLRVRMTEVDGVKKLLIISGHRRFLAAQQAGLTELPYVWAEGDATQILHLEAAENLARVDLNPYEELMTVLKVIAHDFGIGMDEAANLLQEIYALQRRMERRSDNPMTPEEFEEADQQVYRINSLLMSIGYKYKLGTIIRNRFPILDWPPELLERMHQGRLAFDNAQLLSTVSAALRSELLDQAEHLKLDELKERIGAAKPAPAKQPTWEGWREVAKLTKSHPQPPQHVESVLRLALSLANKQQPPQHVESVLRLALSLANKQPSWHTTRVVQAIDVIESGLTPEQEVALEAFLATL